MAKNIRIAVLISGSGSNLQAIINAVSSGYVKNAEIAAVISDRPEAFGLERARKAGIPALVVNPKDCTDGLAFSKKIMDILLAHRVDLVCLAGFLRMIQNPLLEKFKGRIMNIHPALLPKFGGKGMYGHYVHEAVLKAGEKESGPTVHFVDERYDHGPIILQRKVPILPNDTPTTLAERVLQEEHTIYPEAVKLFCEGRLEISDGEVVINNHISR
jgi:phosphoribosylglycinamide formyltransferase 1